MQKVFILLFITIFFIGCSTKQPIKSQSSVILFKTPTMKFYDSGFITKYDNHFHLQIFNVGQLILNLEIYQDKICKGTLQCMSVKDFNSKYFHSTYKDDFLYNPFLQENIYFKDKKNNILIKVKN